MIVTEFYEGQGLGNQLWCYVTLRALAKDKGYKFGIQKPERFKGMDFMDLDFGEPVIGGKGPQGGPPTELPQSIRRYYLERSVTCPDGSDVRTRDEALLSIEDGTKIDGLLQDASYIARFRDDVRSWLKISPEYECFDYSSDDVCVINFRGGGYAKDKKFFLPQKYWDDAVAHMRTINPKFRFVVVSDDPKTAKRFFPDFEAYHWSIAKDYSVIKNAHYLILSNSSFAWFPAWTSERLKYCLAPKYWARHNTSDGYWSLGYNLTDGWHYLDRDGSVTDSAACKKEFDEYLAKHGALLKTVQRYDLRADYVPPKAAPTKRSTGMGATLFRVRAKLVTWGRRIAANRYADALIMGLRERKSKRGWLSPAEIAEYRKKIKVYDVFTFFNELDLLEVRLNILDPHVDYFVLVEATETFSGQPKPLHYFENRDRYAKWSHKIIHYAVKDVPKTEDELRGRLYKGGLSVQERLTVKYTLESHTVGLDVPHWFKEFYIKESTRKALEGLRDEDVCYVSDLDEIWNPELLIDYSKDSVFKPLQKPYAYFLNNRTNEDWRGWTGTIVTKYKNVRGACLNLLRTHRVMQDRYSFLRNGGWHFTFQGGYEGAKRKIDDSNHFWYNPADTLPNLFARIRDNKDYRGRKGVRLWKDERGLPKHILENREKYKKFLK